MQNIPPWINESIKSNKGSDETKMIPNVNDMSKEDVNHTDEVIIGTEQGMTFPTKIGTTMCNALIDTGATKSCISERYYQSLSLTKMQFTQNISARSTTGSNLIPLGPVNCSFELGKIKIQVIS